MTELRKLENTKQMSLEPESPEDYVEMDKPLAGRGGVRLLPVFSGEKFQQQVNYPIIVEAWEKKNSGKHRRRWLETFTKAEQRKIAGYHGRFYRWHLKSGTPKRVSMHLDTLALLQRAVRFFAECT